MTEMKDRIRQLMEAQHMTQLSFATFIGVAPATVSNILSGRTKPTLSIVEAIRQKFPMMNTDWLLFGKGTIFNEDESESMPSSTPAADSHEEPMLNFGDDQDDSARGPLFQSAAHVAAPRDTMPYAKKTQPMRTDIICDVKEKRRITEIRVFYDDQTWESFVPKK